HRLAVRPLPRQAHVARRRPMHALDRPRHGRTYALRLLTRVRVDSLDHLVLTVADVEATCAFYRRVLGMEIVMFAGGRKALVFGRQKINLHQRGREFEPKAEHPTPGAGDLCFITSIALPEVIGHLLVEGVLVI